MFAVSNVLRFWFCYITNFTINYRAPFGTSVNTSAAQTAIANYINSLTYPDVYTDSTVSQIMLSAGATGVTSIAKMGIIYPSLGSYFVAQDGTQTSVPRILTTDLTVPANVWGVGARNINYILSAATVTFNAVSY